MQRVCRLILGFILCVSFTMVILGGVWQDAAMTIRNSLETTCYFDNNTIFYENHGQIPSVIAKTNASLITLGLARNISLDVVWPPPSQFYTESKTQPKDCSNDDDEGCSGVTHWKALMLERQTQRCYVDIEYCSNNLVTPSDFDYARFQAVTEWRKGGPITLIVLGCLAAIFSMVGIFSTNYCCPETQNSTTKEGAVPLLNSQSASNDSGSSPSRCISALLSVIFIIVSIILIILGGILISTFLKYNVRVACRFDNTTEFEVDSQGLAYSFEVDALGSMCSACNHQVCNFSHDFTAHLRFPVSKIVIYDEDRVTQKLESLLGTTQLCWATKSTTPSGVTEMWDVILDSETLEYTIGLLLLFPGIALLAVTLVIVFFDDCYQK